MTDPDLSPVVDKEKVRGQPLLAFVPALVRCGFCHRPIDLDEEHPACAEAEDDIAFARWLETEYDR